MQNLDLGLIGNSRISALIDRNAGIVWSCYPRFDGDPICSALLSGQPRPAFGWIDVMLEQQAGASQQYLTNTPILSTRLRDEAGNEVEVVDFAPRFYLYGRMFNPAMLVRIVRPLRGRPRVTIRSRPAREYGAAPAEQTSGAHHIRYGTAPNAARLTTDVPVTAITEERPFFLTEPVTMLFGPDETVDGAPGEIGRRFLDETRGHWLRWVRSLAVPLEWQDVVIRAAITLKLNAYDDTGAVLAAVTTSIPEAADSGRNWDYRFCWLRDAYFVVNALNRLGATGTMQRYIDYILNLVADSRGAPLQPLYGISREQSLAESEVPTLPGYRGMGPVRIGNAAYHQVQNDVYGEVVLAVAHAFFDQRLDHSADFEIFAELEKLGARAVDVHAAPDAGLWELRGTSRIHTFSSVMCWAACDRLARIARHLGLHDRHAHWSANAARIHATICERAWNPRLNAFVATFGGDRLDASLLLLAELQFLPASDPRFPATVRAIEARLRRGDFLLRYDEEDDFGVPESAFLVCTQWWILALTHLGEHERARALFERLLQVRNPLGLLAEDVAPQTGELWGNFPQTYSMVGLILCALRLSRPWEEAY
ncbi:MAG TPA: glycoside hydrolase family 15 protein [Burkholderiaceae bacterium]|nr:glycoside hydrolase family 15 protein [Burkholderiaceae bacterium]